MVRGGNGRAPPGYSDHDTHDAMMVQIRRFSPAHMLRHQTLGAGRNCLRTADD